MKKPKPKSKHHHNLTSLPPSNTLSTPSEFSFAVTRTAVSQICQSIGFKGAQLSALQTLTQIAAIYLQSLAKSAAFFANSSNRTTTNLFDVINAIHDLSSAEGFIGNSSLHSDNCLLHSAAVLDLAKFVNYSIEIPFAKPISRPNSSSIGEGHSSILRVRNELNSQPHIPNWLPPFPDESTYKECKENVSAKRDWLWENSIAAQNRDDKLDFIESKSVGRIGELPAERGRVRFKLGRYGGRRLSWRRDVDGEEKVRLKRKR